MSTISEEAIHVRTAQVYLLNTYALVVSVISGISSISFVAGVAIGIDVSDFAAESALMTCPCTCPIRYFGSSMPTLTIALAYAPNILAPRGPVLSLAQIVALMLP